MSWKKPLAKVLVFSVLELGAVVGVPMNPEKIRRLMQVMNETNVTQVLKSENDDDVRSRKPSW